MGEKRKRIGVDIDEVVAGYMKVFLKRYNAKKKKSLTTNDITHYHLWECGIHNSKEESINEIDEFQSSEDFNQIELIDDAKEGIREISKKWEIYFITSRPEKLKEKTKNFFARHFPQNNYFHPLNK